MGYVTNRGTKNKPKWYGKWKDVDGKWKQKNTKQTSKAEAEKVVASWEARVARGEAGVVEPTPAVLQARTLTVGELCQRYLQEYNRPKIHDIEAYRMHARSIVKQRIEAYDIGSMVAAQVRRVDVDRWRNELQDRYSHGAVNRAMAVLSGVYRWAGDQEILPVRNPCSGAERMPARPSEDHYLMQEVHRLLSLPAVTPMLVTALYTAMRRGELLGLTWARVHLGGEVPRIEAAKSYRGPTKSGKPRVIPIHPELLPVLRAWREQCPETAEGLVFPVYKRINSRNASHTWRMGTPKDLCGIRELLTAANCHQAADPWHACRHTFSTYFLEASGNGDALSKILGHSQGSGATAVTVGYTHTSLAYLHREIVKMKLAPPPLAGISSLDEERRKRAEGEG